MTQRPRLPVTLASALPALEARVFGAVPERIRHEELGAGARKDFTLITKPDGELAVGAVLRMGDEQWPVTFSIADYWSQDPHDVIVAAHGQSRETARTTNFGVQNIGPGTYRSRHPSHLPVLLLNQAILAPLKVVGQPVMLVPTAGAALFTGADDIAGLTRIAELAIESIDEHPLDIVSAAPVIAGERWEPFAWPTVAGARLRDRRGTAKLETAVERLDAAFARACELVRDRIRTDGLPLRHYFGETTSDPAVLEGWRRLSVAFGLDGPTAALVCEAAADSLLFYDAHQAEIDAAYNLMSLERYEFRAHHFLALALQRQGAIVVVDRHADPGLLAADASASPAARAVGAVISLEDEYDGTVEVAEDLSSRLRDAGVGVVAIGEPDALTLVIFPPDQEREVAEADRQIGDPMLLTYL